MIFNSASDIDALGYDFIEEIKESSTVTTTYLCRFDEKKYDPNKGHVKSQPIWQIKRVREEKIGDITDTVIDYPNGSDGYCFAMVDAPYLSYSYRNTKDSAVGFIPA